jgi:hypothetical protein
MNLRIRRFWVTKDKKCGENRRPIAAALPKEKKDTTKKLIHNGILSAQ